MIDSRKENFKTNHPPKILAVGDTGLLGSRFLKEIENLFIVKTVSRSQESFYIGNFSQDEFASIVLKASQPDWIINFAAVTNVDQCEEDSQLAYMTHVKINENISNHLNVSSCKALSISTDHIYDKPRYETSTEKDIQLKNTYALTKLFGESVSQNKQMLHLRTNFFGKSCNQRKSLTDWLYESLQKQDKIKLFSDVYFTATEFTEKINGKNKKKVS